MSVLLIAETNWLENIILAQDSASAFLLRLARTEKIDDALSLLGQISQTTHYADLCERGRGILKELKKLTLDDRTEIKILVFLELIKEEYDLIIFYTEDKKDFDYPEIHEELGNLNVELMFDSGKCVGRVER